MIHEEICTYEVAKLAKEKGFNVPTDHYYHIYDDVIEAQNSLEMTSDGCAVFYNSLNRYRCAAPTQNQLHKWLQDIKEVDIIVPCIDGKYNYVVQGNINYKCAYDGFSSYELALEDGLKYALENLVDEDN